MHILITLANLCMFWWWKEEGEDRWWKEEGEKKEKIDLLIFACFDILLFNTTILITFANLCIFYIVINFFIQNGQKWVSDTCLSTYQCTISLSILASKWFKMVQNDRVLSLLCFMKKVVELPHFVRYWCHNYLEHIYFD